MWSSWPHDGPSLSETLARWLGVRYALATRRLMETEGPEQWRMLRELCGDVVELRRGDPTTQLCELHIRGTLKRSEFTACENELAARIAARDTPRMLVICDHFGGWERGEDWNNLDFMFTHGERIPKIAIVGAGTKESELKAFTGAGMRPTPVKFFTADELPDARSWLLE